MNKVGHGGLLIEFKTSDWFMLRYTFSDWRGLYPAEDCDTTTDDDGIIPESIFTVLPVIND